VFIATSLVGCGSTQELVSRSENLSSTEDVVDGGVDADAAGPADAGTDAPSGAVVTVLVKSASFSPTDVTIHPGDTIHWVWDRGRHNVVSGPIAGGQGVADGKFCNPGAATCDRAPLQAPPYSYDFTFTDVGDYPYFCTPHVSMGMVGTIHVVP
jgi:plastocyanin